MMDSKVFRLWRQSELDREAAQWARVECSAAQWAASGIYGEIQGRRARGSRAARKARLARSMSRLWAALKAHWAKDAAYAVSLRALHAAEDAAIIARR
jgi:hypothetical protein